MNWLLVYLCAKRPSTNLHQPFQVTRPATLSPHSASPSSFSFKTRPPSNHAIQNSLHFIQHASCAGSSSILTAASAAPCEAPLPRGCSRPGPARRLGAFSRCICIAFNPVVTIHNRSAYGIRLSDLPRPKCCRMQSCGMKKRFSQKRCSRAPGISVSARFTAGTALHAQLPAHFVTTYAARNMAGPI